jgi:hypothetical protein
MYSDTDSISVAGSYSKELLDQICIGRAILLLASVSVWPAASIWVLSLLMLHACVVATSHLRFAPSRSIPWPGVRT